MSRPKNKKITISATGPFLHGTVTSYYNECGKKNCICKTDAKFRHGPYYRWGGKIDNKYVSKVISYNTAQECLKRIDNYKKLLKKIEKIKLEGVKHPPWE